MCVCPAGLTNDDEDPTQCADLDECSTSTDDCDEHATCSNTDGGYECDCLPGYSGDGVTCEQTACVEQCPDNATCTPVGDAFECQCDAGYTTEGAGCRNIDECTEGVGGNPACDALATCVDTDGSFTCNCPSGYTTVGTTCMDVDECAAGTHDCGANETCQNQPGSFTCMCTTSSNQVPVLTANTPEVIASGSYGAGYEAWQVFDASGHPIWLSQQDQTPAFVGYVWADGPRTITGYALWYTNGSITERAPRDWTLQGFDGTSWVVLDTRTNQPGWGGSERRVFSVASPGAYSGYRVVITEDFYSGAGVHAVSLGGFELLGCGP